MNKRDLDAMASVDHVQMSGGHASQRLDIFYYIPTTATRPQRKVLGGPLKLRVNGGDHWQKQALLP